ncbi:MAG: 50S ribosomal protein L25/general stress protein Ctc [Gammaproteobacteria bacterium]|nr:50S ribosomal protein L25/general stress protein Ctc [Gammaproteobacteria bacterium]
MSISLSINANIRTDNGKGASRRLRHADKVPGIVYGSNKDPMMLTLAANEINNAVEDEAFFTHILTLNCDGNAEKVIVKDLQRHPSKDNVMHVDFQRIDENHLLHVHTPLHFINEEKAPGVKAGGIISHLKTDIEIACLPKDLPEYIEVDLGSIDMGESLHLSQIVLPEGVSIPELALGEDHDLPIVNVIKPRGEKEASDEEGEAETSE